MSTRRFLAHFPSVAIAIVPGFVLVALASALVVSLAPADPGASASSPTDSTTDSSLPPIEPGPRESTNVGLEKSDYGIVDTATHFFYLLDFETVYDAPSDFDPIVTGKCKAEQCWKRIPEHQDLRTSPDDFQLGGYHYLHTNYIVQFNENKAYLMGDLTLSERSVISPNQETFRAEEEDLGGITMGLEYIDARWKVSGLELDNPPQESPQAN